jgi:hypothetical protein
MSRLPNYNLTLTYNGVELHVQTSNFRRSRGKADTSATTDEGWETHIYDLRNWSFDFTIFYDGAEDITLDEGEFYPASWVMEDGKSYSGTFGLDTLSESGGARGAHTWQGTATLSGPGVRS